MAETTYVVRSTRFGHMRNRAVVESALEQGRIIPPVVEYLEQGDTVKLDSTSEHTKRAHASGAIEKPGEAEERRKAQLEAELASLEAQKAALGADVVAPEVPAADRLVADNSKDELSALAKDRGLDDSGSKQDLAERVAAHDSAQG